jgi:hypothetical protein
MACVNWPLLEQKKINFLYKWHFVENKTVVMQHMFRVCFLIT